MLDSIGNSPRRAVRQGYRRWRGHREPIERRAVAAVEAIREGWRPESAARRYGVNRSYVDLARRLSDADRERLEYGELKLAALWRDYRRQLAERRAQRLAAERQAADAKLDRLVARVGADRIMAALDRATSPQRVAAE